MNLAALWKLPVLFCCENNRYAMGTALDISESQTSITLKAASYEMPAWAVDGMDVEAVESAATKAIESTRARGGPHFLELQTYRFRAHSMFDPELYRSKEEVDGWRHRDPIETFATRLREDGCLNDEQWERIMGDADAAVAAAVEFAEAGTWEQVSDLTRFVHSEGVLA
jgi:TPP-dependent pyruvate/acetoin dehydrogenase alpha subunit